MIDHQYTDELQNALIAQYYSGKDIEYLIKEIENDYKQSLKRKRWLLIFQFVFFFVGAFMEYIIERWLEPSFIQYLGFVLAAIIMFAPILLFYFCGFEDEAKRLKDYYYIATKTKHELTSIKLELKKTKERIE